MGYGLMEHSNEYVKCPLCGETMPARQERAENRTRWVCWTCFRAASHALVLREILNHPLPAGERLARLDEELSRSQLAAREPAEPPPPSSRRRSASARATKRQLQIQEVVDAAGPLTLSEIKNLAGGREETIRRALETLEQQGKVHWIPGDGIERRKDAKLWQIR